MARSPPKLIPDSQVLQVRESVDMLALVQRHGVVLKNAGRSFKGLCPFHEEKSSSFYVWPNERRFKCFGCQAGGDAISFVQRKLGISFVEAVRALAADAGIELVGSPVDPRRRAKEQAQEVLSFAENYFAQALAEPEGAEAREYLRLRHVSDGCARDFRLGWAPPNGTPLVDALVARGLLAAAESVGLVADSRVMFRARVVFPIRGVDGRTTGFGARRFDERDTGPKYLNSRDSELYSKAASLFGVDVARDAIRRKRSVIIVEGYFDVLALQQLGFTNVVALCSTALTSQHLALLAKLGARELVLLLDGDAAGRAAVEAMAGPILSSGAACRVGLLVDGEDPDTLAHRLGAQGVSELLEAARPLSTHLLEVLLPAGVLSSFEDKMLALARLRGVFTALRPGVARSVFAAATARHFGLRVEELEAELPR